MKVAILGAEGALGARIIESFHLGDGPSLTAVARTPAGLGAAARFPIDLRVADLFDIDSLARTFAGCSAAVHVLPVDAAELKRSVVAFCRAGARAGLRRLIYVSTADVYGLNPPPGTTEKSGLHVRHAFDAVNHLVAADQKFSAECRELGIAAIVFRPGLMYGPRSAWLAQVITDLQQDRAWLANHGDGICNCVYLDQVVDAIRLALKPKTLPGPAFIVMNDETVTWREFYQAVASELELLVVLRSLEATASGDMSASPGTTPPALPPETIARHHCTTTLRATLAAARLGLKPALSFPESIRRSVGWWRFARGDFAVA
jgi:nucleoside-diphosphate-sugar epimerase